MTSPEKIISSLGLVPHPEGGYYREVHRSAVPLGNIPGYPAERVASTAIYFLLTAGDVSAFHRVRSEEIWIHLDGEPLDLVVLADNAETHTLAGRGKGRYLAVVPPGAIQAARSTGEWSLTACIVAPGFDFADFEMPARGELLATHPRHADLIRRFTRP